MSKRLRALAAPLPAPGCRRRAAMQGRSGGGRRRQRRGRASTRRRPASPGGHHRRRRPGTRQPCQPRSCRSWRRSAAGRRAQRAYPQPLPRLSAGRGQCRATRAADGQSAGRRGPASKRSDGRGAGPSSSSNRTVSECPQFGQVAVLMFASFGLASGRAARPRPRPPDARSGRHRRAGSGGR